MRRQLERRGIASETFISRGPGEVVALTQSVVEAGFTTIVAVGGDGTVHEVVNGLGIGIAERRVQLAVLPAGTGMDFERNLDLRRGVDAAVRRVVANRPRLVDLGLANGDQPRLFVNFAEVGLGAAVVAREATMSGSLPGRSSFLIAALAAAVGEKPIRARIAVDGTDVYEGSLVSAVVANGPYLGGGMKIAPQAVVDDGLFDVLVLGDFTRAELVTQIWKVYPGIHVQHAKVHWMRGAAVQIVPEAPARLDLDGELYPTSARDFTILPQALPVLT